MASVRVSTVTSLAPVAVVISVHDTRKRKADGKAVGEHNLGSLIANMSQITERMAKDTRRSSVWNDTGEPAQRAGSLAKEECDGGGR